MIRLVRMILIERPDDGAVPDPSFPPARSHERVALGHAPARRPLPPHRDHAALRASLRDGAGPRPIPLRRRRHRLPARRDGRHARPLCPAPRSSCRMAAPISCSRPRTCPRARYRQLRGRTGLRTASATCPPAQGELPAAPTTRSSLAAAWNSSWAACRVWFGSCPPSCWSAPYPSVIPRSWRS